MRILFVIRDTAYGTKRKEKNMTDRVISATTTHTKKKCATIKVGMHE